MQARRVFFIISVIVLGIFAYTVGSAFYISKASGTLHVTSSPNALLVISQADHQAKIIGIGGAKILLKPGSYQLSATDGAKQKFAVVNINKKRLVDLSLIPTASALLPSPESIQFSGINALINDGLTTNQVSAFKLAVFDFKSSAQKVVIDQSSVVAEPHALGADFKLDFKAKIDNTVYKATVSYSDLNSILLYLYNPINNSQVFSSGVISN